MEKFGLLNIINVIAIIVIPIVTVIIGQKLQDRSEKRKDKMNVFTHLMSYRMFGYTTQYSVNVFNSVPIIFNDDKYVIEKYNIYLKSLMIRKEDIPIKEKEIENNKTKMLEAMAKSLGYKKINWELIQNPYVPTGLLEQIEAENIFKKGQLEMAKVFANYETQKESVQKFGLEIEKRYEVCKNIEDKSNE
jgi:hypothetical protein